MKREDWMAIGLVVALLYVGTSLFFSTMASCDINLNYTTSFKANYSEMPNIAEIKVNCFNICLEKVLDIDLKERCIKECAKL